MSHFDGTVQVKGDTVVVTVFSEADGDDPWYPRDDDYCAQIDHQGQPQHGLLALLHRHERCRPRRCPCHRHVPLQIRQRSHSHIFGVQSRLLLLQTYHAFFFSHYRHYVFLDLVIHKRRESRQQRQKDPLHSPEDTCAQNIVLRGGIQTFLEVSVLFDPVDRHQGGVSAPRRDLP